MGCVIERKRRPTSKNTQQPNQSPKEQVQKSNTSHAEEACRLRAGRRAIRVPRDTQLCASRDARFCAPGARRSAHRERAVLCTGSAPFSAPGARRSARRVTRRSARRKTRGLHVVRRAGARRVRAGCAQRARAGPAGPAFLFSLRSPRAPRSVGPRAGGGTPGVAPRCAGRPPHT